MYVRNCWYVAGWSHEFPEDQLIARTIAEAPLVLYRKADGKVVAMEDRCCHRQAKLSLGLKEGDYLRCGYHGLKFAPDGACVEIPGQDRIPPRARVRTYPVIERHSWIWVWMGDAQLADPDLVPPAVGLDDPRYVLRTGVLDFAVNYLLINDNLGDFSHLTFVHARTFGGGNLGHLWAATHPRITRLERGIRVERWMVGNTGFSGEEKPPVDVWHAYDFLAPSVLLMRLDDYPPGTAAAADYREPTAVEPLARSFTSQAVTPVAANLSRYHFSFGPGAPEAFPGLADSMLALTEAAFAEDRRMLEGQQHNWQPGARMIGIEHDRGPTMMRAVIEKLIKAEAVASGALEKTP